MPDREETIVAVSTPFGTGGIAVIRLSGPDALEILSRCWSGRKVTEFKSHSLYLGWITDSSGEKIDQVVAAYFKAPKSYTGEDVVEISCHGSLWIQQTLVNRLIDCGARGAGSGEFTKRAFMNGRLDLAQAEGVADLIAASSKAAARLAASQLKGDFSKKLEFLRSRLIDLGSLLELELDFSEEDVEFANRGQLINLTEEVLETVSRLVNSYKAGNAFKQGIPVVIAGVPNAGKSTLMNVLVGEEKAIVSEIAGTTRDVIEDTVEISGLLFRFFDTAGLRQSEDVVENIGVERARKKMKEAFIIIRLIDSTGNVSAQLDQIGINSGDYDAKIVTVITKKDINNSISCTKDLISEKDDEIMFISAKTGEGIDELRQKLVSLSTSDFNPERELVVTNARHYEALLKSQEALSLLLEGLESGLSADFLAQDLREATHYLGSITGSITSDDLLHTIFSRYCIGK